MASPLAKQWQQLKLTDEEEQVVRCEAGGEEDFEMKAALALAGKYHSKTVAKSQSIRYFLKTAWSKTRKGFSVKDMGDNLFIFQFFTRENKEMVMKGGPWIYERHILTLAEIRGDEEIAEMEFNRVPFLVRAYGLPLNRLNRRTAETIGRHFGGLLEFKEGDLLGWSKYLRMKIELDIRKPLRRGMLMAFEEGNTKWISFKYEKVPLFCFGCGRLGHVEDECMENDGEKNQYGEGLRATPERGQKQSNEEREKEESLMRDLKGMKDRGRNEMRMIGNEENSKARRSLMEVLQEVNSATRTEGSKIEGKEKEAGMEVSSERKDSGMQNKRGTEVSKTLELVSIGLFLELVSI